MLHLIDGKKIKIKCIQILLLNFRKEILPFLPKTKLITNTTTSDDCSDVLVVNDTMALAVHNEDANVSLIGHV